jgi:hypothetical protein
MPTLRPKQPVRAPSAPSHCRLWVSWERQPETSSLATQPKKQEWPPGREPPAVRRQTQTLAVAQLQVELPMVEWLALRQELSDLSNPPTQSSRARLREPMARAQPQLSSAATQPQLAEPR